MRKRLLRSAVIIPLVLLITALSSPAFATPLTATTARAYGINLDLLDANVIDETPLQTAGPGINQGADNLVEVPLEQVAFVGLVGAKAQTRRDSVIEPELPLGRLTVTQGGPAKPALYNAQAFARSAGAVALPPVPVVGTDPLAAVRLLTGDDALGDILAVDAVVAEALVSCVDFQPVIAGGGLLTGVRLLGQDLTDAIDGTANQVIDVVDPLAGTVIPGSRLVANEQIRTPNGLVVNGLHLFIPNLIDLVLSHAEVSGAVCEPAPAPPKLLPRTGGDSAGLGVAILAGGVFLLEAQRRRRAKLGRS